MWLTDIVKFARRGLEDEGWRVRKDGSQFIASIVINAVQESGGKTRGFVKNTRDISDRKRIENRPKPLLEVPA